MARVLLEPLLFVPSSLWQQCTTALLALAAFCKSCYFWNMVPWLGKTWSSACDRISQRLAIPSSKNQQPLTVRDIGTWQKQPLLITGPGSTKGSQWLLEDDTELCCQLSDPLQNTFATQFLQIASFSHLPESMSELLGLQPHFVFLAGVACIKLNLSWALGLSP